MATGSEFTELKTKVDYMISAQAMMRADFKEVISELKIHLKEIRDQSNQNATDITTIKGVSMSSKVWGTIFGFAISTLITLAIAYSSIQEQKPSGDVMQNQITNLLSRQDKLESSANKILGTISINQELR